MAELRKDAFETAARELANLVQRVERLEAKVLALPEETACAGVPRQFWSVNEFAALLGVGKHVIYRATDRNEIAWIKVGGSKRIPNSELERLLAEAYEPAPVEE